MTYRIQTLLTILALASLLAAVFYANRYLAGPWLMAAMLCTYLGYGWCLWLLHRYQRKQIEKSIANINALISDFNRKNK